MAAFASPASGPAVGLTQPVPPRCLNKGWSAPGPVLATRVFDASWTRLQTIGASSAVGFMALFAQNRRSRKARGKQTDRVRAQAYNHDYKLEHKDRVRKIIDTVGDGPMSLESYMRAPVREFAQVPLPAGVKLVSTGRKPGSDGIEQEAFDLIMPTITVPGFFKLKSVVKALAWLDEDGLVIEGNEMVFTSGLPNKDDINARLKFYQKSKFTWEDSPTKKEFILDCHAKFAIDMPGAIRFAVGKSLFEKLGDSIMKIVLSLVMNAFIDARVNDYTKWATDADYRKARSEVALIY